jgi:hypothetical protein
MLRNDFTTHLARKGASRVANAGESGMSQRQRDALYISTGERAASGNGSCAEASAVFQAQREEIQ